MAGWTNRFKYKLLGWAFQGSALPGNFYVALFTAATAPTADINTKSELTEIATGSGYNAGGIALPKNAAGFDVWTEDDANDRALIQAVDLVWTASGGSIPASGNGARYACLTDDNGTQGSREIYVFWDLSSDRQVSDTQTLTLQNCEFRITE